MWAKPWSSTIDTFWKNGRTVKIVVFDDSIPANQQKYFPLLEQTRTHNELYYVGPHEKDLFLAYVNKRLRDPRLEGFLNDSGSTCASVTRESPPRNRTSTCRKML